MLLTFCSVRSFAMFYILTYFCLLEVKLYHFFVYSYFIYLFIYLFLAVLGLRFVGGLSPVAASGGHSSSRCGDRSSSRCAGLSLSQPLLWSTGSRRAGSVIVAHGPSRSAACGIFPDQGSQPLRHQGSPAPIFILQTSPSLHTISKLSFFIQ